MEGIKASEPQHLLPPKAEEEGVANQLKSDDYPRQKSPPALGTAASESGGVKPAEEVGSPPFPSQSSKLEDTQRRRLSISTVQSQDLLSLPRKGLPAVAAAVAAEETVEEPRSPSKQPDEDTMAAVAARGRRTPIRKFADSAMQLVNQKTGGIREVSVDMILDLVSASDQTFCVFGSPCERIQSGFDDKRLRVAGTMARTFRLGEHGIAYSCKKGLKPESPNQDDFFILRVDDWSLYGVFDGHGPHGHEVSSFAHRALPFLVMSDSSFESDPLLAMRRSFRKAHRLLEAANESHDERGLDCTLSGTTGTMVLCRDRKLYIAHVGDSRAVLATKNGDDRFRAVDLTVDHKPTREDEKKRIEASGGEVRRLEGDIPHRVFVKNRMFPGLAMSRALGDTVGSAVGVIPDPDVRVVELSPSDQFVIVSTDGVWEFISSQEAVDFVCSKQRSGVDKAAEFLGYESWRRWIEEEENVVDDVTCVIFWLDH